MLCNVCETSHRLGTWLAPNAIRCSHGLREPKYHSYNCLLSFDKRNTCHLQIQTQWNIQICHLQWDLSHRLKSCLYQSFRKIWLVAMTTVILKKITNSKKRTVLTAIRHLKQVVPQLNLLWKGDFNDLVCD